MRLERMGQPRTQFSTITTAPSMMMPKSGPQAHQVGAHLVADHPVKVNSMDSGITIAVIMAAARMLPRNRNRMTIT